MPQWKTKSWQEKALDWKVELGFLAFLLLYVANYFYGSLVNKEVALRWLRVVRPLFVTQFSRVDVLSRTSPSTFELYCTGRKNCYGANVSLTLHERQDMLALIMSLFTKVGDEVSVDIPMTDAMAPILLCICRESKEKKWKEEFPELGVMAKVRKVDGMAPSLCFMSDSAELSSLVDVAVSAVLEKHSDLIKLIYVTDVYDKGEYDQVARFVFRMPRAKHMDDMGVLLRLVMHMVDLFAAFKLSSQQLSKARAKRKKYLAKKMQASREEREEEVRRKKSEKLQKERDHINSLTGVERQKAEAKLAKKQHKKQQKRARGMVKVLK